MQRLLAVDLVLVCWDTQRGKPHGRSGMGLPAAVGGALLLDAVLDGALDIGDGRVQVTGRPASDPLVAEIVSDVAGRRRPPRPKAVLGSRGTRRLRAVERRMVADGHLDPVERRVLGLFPVRRHQLTAPTDQSALRERIRRLLAGEQDPEDSPDREVILASLAGAAGAVEMLFPRGQRKAAKERAEAFRDGVGISAAASEAVREAQAAVVAAMTAATVASTASN